MIKTVNVYLFIKLGIGRWQKLGFKFGNHDLFYIGKGLVLPFVFSHLTFEKFGII